VSELFDSLRRGRQTRFPQKTQHTARGDAVLAALGCAPPRRLSRPRSLTGAALVLAGILVTAALGWTLSHRSAQRALAIVPNDAGTRHN
jgi:hypothetical protein